MGMIVTVTGKPVKFPNQYSIKQFFAAVLNHAEKIKPLICVFGGRQGTVNIGVDNVDIIAFGVLLALP